MPCSPSAPASSPPGACSTGGMPRESALRGRHPPRDFTHRRPAQCTAHTNADPVGADGPPSCSRFRRAQIQSVLVRAEQLSATPHPQPPRPASWARLNATTVLTVGISCRHTAAGAVRGTGPCVAGAQFPQLNAALERLERTLETGSGRTHLRSGPQRPLNQKPARAAAINYSLWRRGAGAEARLPDARRCTSPKFVNLL